MRKAYEYALVNIMEKSNSKPEDWIKAGIVVAISVFLFRTVQSAGLVSGIGAQDQKLTLGVSFLIGVAASLSSCLAVVGGMVIAFSEKYKAGSGDNFFKGAFLPNIKFHVGRVLTFFALGGLLGAIGGKINLSGNFFSIYTILIAVVMGWLGLNILGIAPSISLLGIKTPKFLLRWWGRLEDTEHKAAPYLLGGITFFLPCGFTQSMQIFALASGSFWTGAFILSIFSIGTMPVLLMLGATASWANSKKISFVNKAAGILVILFAIFMFNSGLALKGVRTNVISGTTNGEQSVAKKNSNRIFIQNEQIVRMSVTNRGFEPSALKIKGNVPVSWVVMGDQVSGCTNKIIIPSLDIAKNINSGENIISFMPTDTREIPFSCGMGMVRGKFIVE